MRKLADHSPLSSISWPHDSRTSSYNASVFGVVLTRVMYLCFRAHSEFAAVSCVTLLKQLQIFELERWEAITSKKLRCHDVIRTIFRMHSTTAIMLLSHQNNLRMQTSVHIYLHLYSTGM